jgi:hypothetical protein
VKKYYLILEKKKKYQYGVFPRTKEGREKAKNYVKKLEKEHELKFFLK